MAKGRHRQTVCIVGAGQSGIAALKETVTAGFEPTLYDLDTDIGGLWHKKDPDKPSTTASVWDNLTSNTSKYMVCFSDFPPDPKDPVFLTARNLVDYLKRAVKHFSLERYIHLNTRVSKIRETDDHDRTGRWEVYTCPSGHPTSNDLSGTKHPVEDALAHCQREVFDYVIVCCGWFVRPNYPDIPGMDRFQGAISHSFTYSDPRHFDGKKVLVVGNRFSASEIACDVCPLAKETYMALGQGTWIIPRLCHNGRPSDLTFSRSKFMSRNPGKTIDECLVREANFNMDHVTSGVRPPMTPSKGGPICISDELPAKMASGRIKPYAHLAELTETAAIFKEGQIIPELDAIIFCTGYQQHVPFLDLKLKDDDGVLQLYMLTYPLNRKHNTLGFIGHYRSDGPLFVMAEVQARLVTYVMTGAHQLPGQKVMAESVEHWGKLSLAKSRGYWSFSVPGFSFMDVLAGELGIMPCFWKLLLRDPVLAWRTWYGPYMAAQYRLLGPDSQWEAARQICYRGYHEGLACLNNSGRGVLPSSTLLDKLIGTGRDGTGRVAFETSKVLLLSVVFVVGVVVAMPMLSDKVIRLFSSVG